MARLPRFRSVARSGSCPSLSQAEPGSPLAIVATQCNLWTWKESDQRRCSRQTSNSTCSQLDGVCHRSKKQTQEAHATFSRSASHLSDLRKPRSSRTRTVGQSTLDEGTWETWTSVSPTKADTPSRASSLGRDLSPKVTQPMEGTRVAVIGAGPVGLWIAVLLARAHARFFHTSSGFRISRLPQAPSINVAWLKHSSAGAV